MRRVRGLAAMFGAAIVCALVPGIVPSGAPRLRAQSSTVGVVDFYAPSPLGEYVGLTPERFASELLASLLSRAAGGRLNVVPHDAMWRAEQGMRWQDVDVLHYARLTALAEAVGADRLVVGRIPLLAAGTGGGNSGVPPDGEGPPFADVTLVLQVFDRTEGRLVAEKLQRASGMGMDRTQAAEFVLHEALARALPDILRWLGAQAP